MKRKITTIFTTGRVLLMALTGCGDSSDRDSVRADSPSYVAEHPDGSRVEISPEEAEEISELQKGLANGAEITKFENEYAVLQEEVEYFCYQHIPITFGVAFSR